MRRHALLPALALVLILAVPGRSAAIPFPQAESDLKPDPAARFGTLQNGVRYVIMPNHEPKARVSLRLLVLAGSFDETESQRGLAHYLEHMAFNGSTHYAPGTLVERLQRLGMGFGADTNAATSFDHTVFQLEMPDNSGATVSEGLQILADYAGGLLLQQKMVDKERGIILSEKRTRDSVAYRTMLAQYGFMGAGTLIPERMPIGLQSVIEKADRSQFVDFWNTWYRPDNMVVIVVGDIDPASVETRVTSEFSPEAPRSPEPKAPDLGHVAVFSGVKTLYHPEPEAPVTDVVIATTVPYSHEADTAANRVKYLPRYLAVDMLNRRLEILAKKEGAPFIRASTSVEEWFDFVRSAEINISCKPEQWTAALIVADSELRRALSYGFRPDELKEQVAIFRNELLQAQRTESTRRSDELAGEIADSIVEKNVFTSPEEDLALYGPALDKVTTEDCLRILRDSWGNPGRYVFVSGNVKLPAESETIIRNVYAGAEAQPVAPTQAEKLKAWQYTSFGPEGHVAHRSQVGDLGITQIVFANGVRLNLKKTPFEANTVHIQARVGTGQLTEPPTEPGLATFGRVTYSRGGLGRHSADEWQKILAGHTVGVSFAPEMDAFVFSGKSNREDLALELQLMTASISDAGYRPEAMREARKRINEAYISFEHTINGPLALEVPKLLSSGDPRFGLPSRDRMMAISLDELRAWLAPQMADGPVEISIVGDVDEDAAVSAVARTLGALPARKDRPDMSAYLKVGFPGSPFTKSFGIQSDIPKALVEVYYPTTDGIDAHRERRLQMLGEIFSDRLRVKVREQMGDSYSPSVRSVASEIFPGYGYFSATVVVAPDRADDVSNVVMAVAADLQANGVTEDELARAKNPSLKHIDEDLRDNDYWMSVLDKSQQRPEELDSARTLRADTASITAADVDALAKAYLAPSRASRVIIRPYAVLGTGPLRPGQNGPGQGGPGKAPPDGGR